MKERKRKIERERSWMRLERRGFVIKLVPLSFLSLLPLEAFPFSDSAAARDEKGKKGFKPD